MKLHPYHSRLPQYHTPKSWFSPSAAYPPLVPPIKSHASRVTALSLLGHWLHHITALLYHHPNLGTRSTFRHRRPPPKQVAFQASRVPTDSNAPTDLTERPPKLRAGGRGGSVNALVYKTPVAPCIYIYLPCFLRLDLHRPHHHHHTVTTTYRNFFYRPIDEGDSDLDERIFFIYNSNGRQEDFHGGGCEAPRRRQLVHCH